MLGKLVDITLRLVERDGGIRGLSLREIAREAGCSHVNLYHYANGLSELVWRAYCRALEEYRDHCVAGIAGRARGEHPLVSYARSALEYAGSHEGSYRLLWMDDLGHPPPVFALETIRRVSGEFVGFAGEGLGQEGAAEKADIFGSWLLGKLSFYVSGRFVGGKAEAGRDIMEGAERLALLLAERRQAKSSTSARGRESKVHE